MTDEDKVIQKEYDEIVERASKKINKEIQDLKNNCREYEMREHLFKIEISSLQSQLKVMRDALDDIIEVGTGNYSVKRATEALKEVEG